MNSENRGSLAFLLYRNSSTSAKHDLLFSRLSFILPSPEPRYSFSCSGVKIDEDDLLPGPQGQRPLKDGDGEGGTEEGGRGRGRSHFHLPIFGRGRRDVGGSNSFDGLL